jgi:hypothetical protein
MPTPRLHPLMRTCRDGCGADAGAGPGTAARRPAGPQQALRALDAPQAARARRRRGAAGRGGHHGRCRAAWPSGCATRTRRARTRRSALWLIWSRSGDRAVDRLLARGVEQMGAGELRRRAGHLHRVVQRRPAFAEGWNKRATVRFMLGEDEASLKDCERCSSATRCTSARCRAWRRSTCAAATWSWRCRPGCGPCRPTPTSTAARDAGAAGRGGAHAGHAPHLIGADRRQRAARGPAHCGP